jgi:hypothetical protein
MSDHTDLDLALGPVENDVKALYQVSNLLDEVEPTLEGLLPVQTLLEHSIEALDRHVKHLRAELDRIREARRPIAV